MIITFALRAWDGEVERLITEAQLTGEGGSLRALLTGLDGYGYVTFQHEGMNDVVIEDELAELLPELCATAIPGLLAVQAVSVRFYRYFGGVELTPDGTMIRLSRDRADLARYPSTELLVALASCGARYLDLQRRLHGDFGDIGEQFVKLQRAITHAATTLGDAHLASQAKLLGSTKL